MTTTEENKQADLTASTPEETPTSEAADARTPTDTSDDLQQAEPEVAPTPGEDITQPRLPGTAGKPVKTRILPERQTPEPSLPAEHVSASAKPMTGPSVPMPTPPARTPAPAQPEPAEVPPKLADLGWMPPPEDQVARFLSDVADIAPPPVREREGSRIPGFMLPSVTSPEEVERKKAKAEPFWSQVVATPMEQPAPPPAPASQRRGGQKRQRLRRRWLLIGGGIVLLLVVGLIALALTHPALLHGKL